MHSTVKIAKTTTTVAPAKTAPTAKMAKTTTTAKMAKTTTTAEQRRRRHLAVYHRALRAAKSPQQRAAVAARYRKLFAIDAGSESPRVAEPIRLPVGLGEPVRLAS